VFGLIARLGAVPPAQMWEVFNMGCGFVAVVPEERAADAVAVLGARHPGAAPVGSVTAEGGHVTVAGIPASYT
jgi:phosphoribosylformylglycinamidine cyclo-ligase